MVKALRPLDSSAVRRRASRRGSRPPATGSSNVWNGPLTQDLTWFDASPLFWVGCAADARSRSGRSGHDRHGARPGNGISMTIIRVHAALQHGRYGFGLPLLSAACSVMHQTSMFEVFGADACIRRMANMSQTP